MAKRRNHDAACKVHVVEFGRGEKRTAMQAAAETQTIALDHAERLCGLPRAGKALNVTAILAVENGGGTVLTPAE